MLVRFSKIDTYTNWNCKAGQMDAAIFHLDDEKNVLIAALRVHFLKKYRWKRASFLA